ncbi:MAG: site-2 protease family protein [Pseudomonadota bacterium]|nr:site-2 protease family protein [Pseudomonadota bacterium]
MNELSTIQYLVVLSLPLLFAITVHEVAHGWVAFKLGDPTAQRLGRLTLNPIKHIDILGTLIVPLAIFILSSQKFIFGWAKPVPINWHNLRHPRRDMALVALAGPGSNLLMAFCWALISKLGVILTAVFPASIFLAYMGLMGILVNIILMLLNLIPILPLDGGRVLHSLLPPSLARPFAQIEPYGIFVLIILLMTGVLGKILFPVVALTYNQFSALVGL